jgi:signal transduction histidine kinase
MSATTKYGPGAIGSLVRFGLLALLPVVALGAVLAHVLNADVQQRYLDTARTSATLIAQVGIHPLLNPQQLTNGLSPAEVAQIDDKLQGAAVSDEVSRIKVWNRSGTIVYSDNHVLIGKTYPIDEDLGAALAGRSSSSITAARDAENADDILIGPLIQVYVPLVFKGTTSPGGVFELYLPYAPVQKAIDTASNRLYLFLAAGLALFYISMFPVVLLADRWRRRLLREAQATALANLAVLERLNTIKTDFLTRVSHQFRTALVGIQGFSEVIRDSDHLDLAEVRAFASDINKDAERLDQAFNEMLELDQLEAGQAALKITKVNLDNLITGVVEEARKRSPDHPITLQLDRLVPTISCDMDKVSQAISILLSNATKYSPAGREILVTSRASANDVKITVKDQGRGMPPDYDDGLIAGSRRRATGSRMNRAVAGGLGLQIARQIAQMHGGRIWFESVAGKGTEFHFTLPIQARASQELRAVARPHQGGHGRQPES